MEPIVSGENYNNEIITISNDYSPILITGLSVAELIEQAEPLDLIIFRGTGVVSDLIARFEQDSLRIYEKVFHVGDKLETACTHAGIVITRKMCPKIRTDSLPIETKLIYESTCSGELTDGIPNAETGNGFLGVQVRNLADVAAAYLQSKNSAVALCKLKNNPTRRDINESEKTFELRQKKLRKALKSVYSKYNHKHYTVNMFDLLAAAFPKLRPIRRATDDLLNKVGLGSKNLFFCSQFVALVWQSTEIISKKIRAADFTPEDLVSGQDIDGFKPVVDDPIWVHL